jgi:acetate kinase
MSVVLCINTGSSSLKCALYRIGDDGETLLARHDVGDLSPGSGAMSVALDESVASFEQEGHPAPDAAGHRVVHGGPDLAAPVRVDDALLGALRHLVPLAPLHLPSAISAIEAVGRRFPMLVQVACFDTAFHHHMPERAKRFALPAWLWDEGVRRYGFHGLSYEYVVGALGADLGERAVIAHLGNGASMVALVHGASVDTTMGLTPAGGLVMGTRSGDLDPGVLVYLARQHGAGADRLEQVVGAEAGLLGLAGTTSDMRTLLETRSRDPRAALAIDVFCYQARKHVGALAAALGGLDTLVFTGGIGERAVPVRAAICDGLGHLGVVLDAQRNDASAGVVSSDTSGCTVRVVRTDEDLVIARHTAALVIA